MTFPRATTFELLPEQIDLFGWVLSAAGFGALLGSLIGLRRGDSHEKRAIRAENFALLFAGLAVPAFLGAALIQAIT